KLDLLPLALANFVANLSNERRIRQRFGEKRSPCVPNFGKLPFVIDSLPRPDVIITHESDLDGLLAGVLLQRLARKLFNADVPLEAYHYHTWRQRELREKAGWVTDLNFEQRMDKHNWVTIDHHVTEVAPKNT